MRYIFLILTLSVLFSNCKKVEIQIKEVKTSALLVSAKNLNLGAPENSTANLDLASNVDWTAASNQTWLKVSSDKGTGNASLTLTATANTTTSARTATVTISGTGVTAQTVSVSQAGMADFLTVSANSLNVNATAASTASFDIASNIAWTVSSSQTWLVASNSAGNGNLKITLTAAANDLFAGRNALVTVVMNGVVSQTITVTQAAATLAVNAKPNWAVSALDFQYSMTYVAKVSITSAVQAIADGDELAAFVGIECRGIATVITNTGVLGSTITFFLLIKGNQTSGENLSFKYYQKTSSHIFDLNLTKDFIANQTYGSPDIPYVFEVK